MYRIYCFWIRCNAHSRLISLTLERLVYGSQRICVRTDVLEVVMNRVARNTPFYIVRIVLIFRFFNSFLLIFFSAPECEFIRYTALHKANKYNEYLIKNKC